jgi:hypothetical protein
VRFRGAGCQVCFGFVVGIGGRGADENRWFADSALEGAGFKLQFPADTQVGLIVQNPELRPAPRTIAGRAGLRNA